MTIDLTTVVQWIGTAVAAFVSWLMWHYSKSLDNRFLEQDKSTSELGARMDKLEDRVNTEIPKSVESLRKEIYALDSKVGDLGAKVASIETRVTDNYIAFIRRVDRLEDSLPQVMEGVFYKLFIKHPAMASYIKDPSENSKE